ncbi:uncharacterized protein LOC113855768 [Abrus precatorius]|uniref:Uncharacterized protein LOC113855768 n=1 Tax=Abrus precatorius TaxID=3816 RepID=A0A8B8KHF0_ABRPR|nr:uncharacterized protein LOC113855768 [Abrus precatorius]
MADLCSWPSVAELNEMREKVSKMAHVNKEEVRVVVSPYRICPLGAHIDHQGGTVLAMTIDRGILLGFAPSDSNQVVIRSGQFQGEVKFRVNEIQKPRQITRTKDENSEKDSSRLQEQCNWGRYARGAVYALQSRGNNLSKGITGYICGSEGLDSSGLSSSAAVGVAYLLALEYANNLVISPTENIEYDRLIENEYLGLKNGIMDQSAILLSASGCLMCMNCKTKDYQLVYRPKVLECKESEQPRATKILLALSGLKQALTNNPGYNKRVVECQEAAQILLKASGEYKAEPILSNVEPEVYETHKCKLEPDLVKRAEHYFSENMRVMKGVEAWSMGKLKDFGMLISASGRSSIQNYECGAEPMIQLYEILLRAPGVLGARFSGAGFRGCCVAFVEAHLATEAATFVRKEYLKVQPEFSSQIGNDMVVICEPGDCARITLEQQEDEPATPKKENMGSNPLSALTSTKPSPIPTQDREEQDSPSSTQTLLSFNTDSSSSSSSPSSSSHKALFFSLILITCIALSATFAFAFLFFSSSSSPPPPTSTAHTPSSLARSLTKLKRPVVLLVSSDGFRFGYQFKTFTPNIARLIANGTEAETGLIPVFPSLTFPNHYSIVTGLYPAYHGIINNHFLDPHSGEAFYMGSHDPKWWLGEPLWETVVNNGLKAATYFWPGSEVKKGPWTCPVNYCRHYNGSVSFEERVDSVLNYFDLPSDEIPDFMTLYFEDPDHQGHRVGADDPEITEAVARIDSMMGRLIKGLEQRGIFEDVSIIMVGDHGMVGTCDKKLIFLDDLGPWIDVPKDWVLTHSPVLAIRPPPGFAPSDVVAKMNEGLSSGKVENGKNLRVYLKEDLPSRLHYAASDRIPPIIGLLEEGFKVEQKKTKRQECGGSHGYDNAIFSMRTIFIGHGPQFARGRKIPSFENVQIYNLITSILKIKGAPNNGSASFAESVLLPGA